MARGESGGPERVNEFETAGMNILCRDDVGGGRWKSYALGEVG